MGQLNKRTRYRGARLTDGHPRSCAVWCTLQSHQRQNVDSCTHQTGRGKLKIQRWRWSRHMTVVQQYHHLHYIVVQTVWSSKWLGRACGQIARQCACLMIYRQLAGRTSISWWQGSAPFSHSSRIPRRCINSVDLSRKYWIGYQLKRAAMVSTFLLIFVSSSLQLAL